MKTSKFSRLGLVLLVLVLCTILDQGVKALARNSLVGQPPILLLSGFIRIEYLENAGVILGLGSNMPELARFLFFVAFAAVALGVSVILALKIDSLNWIQLVGLSMVAGGGLGNLLDRLFNHGKVVDFVSFGFSFLRTGVMNLADIEIFVGAGIFLAYSFSENKQLEEAASQEPAAQEEPSQEAPLPDDPSNR